MVGTCGFTSFNCPSDSAEVGYVLNPDYWGKGIAAAALERVLRFGFSDLRLHRIAAKFIKGTAASLNVMERCGMTFDGSLRAYMLVKGTYVTVGICSILADEWKSK